MIEETQDEYVNVAQGCYAEITADTPPRIRGLVTFGMGTCTHVIVTRLCITLPCRFINKSRALEQKIFRIPSYFNDIKMLSKETLLAKRSRASSKD